MAESLSDREFESKRRVRPDRLVRNRTGGGQHHEEYAVAVVDEDGQPLGVTTSEVLLSLLWETRRTNMLLQLLTGKEVTIGDAAV